jgi:hypothetical protein
MKKIQQSFIALALVTILFVQSGCFGSFALVHKLYDWNDNMSDSKFVKSLVFWVLLIIPVYGIASFIDVVILNLIEFWSGSNPISMNPGDHEEQIITKGGITYKMEATQNQLMTTTLTGKNKGKVEKLVYNPANQTWNLEKDGHTLALGRVEMGKDGNLAARIFTPNNSSVVIALPTTENELAQRTEALKAYKFTAAK